MMEWWCQMDDLYRHEPNMFMFQLSKKLSASNVLFIEEDR